MKTNPKTIQRARRQKRIRAKIAGTAECPRLSVFKSNRFISAQVIDDDNGVTLVSFSSQALKGKKADQAKEVGKEVAKLAKSKGIDKVVFDRGGYIYTGRVQAVAEGAREGGLEF